MIHAIKARYIAAIPGVKRYVVVLTGTTDRTHHVQSLYNVIDRFTQKTVYRMFSKALATYKARQLNDDYETEALWTKLHERT